jgi:hypothetical protein
MRRLSIALLLLLTAASPAGRMEVRTAAIAQETQRSWQQGSRIIHVWWLPVEYWEAAARELKRSPEEVEAARRLLREHTVLVVIDARLTEEQRFSFQDHSDIGPRLHIERDGERIAPLRSWDPALTELVPNLSHVLRAAAGPLNVGVRLLFFPNLGEQGEPIVGGAQRGVLRVRYEPAGGVPPLDLVWHAPLTAVAGSRADPQTGEPVEASWRYNPWTGEKLPE